MISDSHNCCAIFPAHLKIIFFFDNQKVFSVSSLHKRKAMMLNLPLRTIPHSIHFLYSASCFYFFSLCSFFPRTAQNVLLKISILLMILSNCMFRKIKKTGIHSIFLRLSTLSQPKSLYFRLFILFSCQPIPFFV